MKQMILDVVNELVEASQKSVNMQMIYRRAYGSIVKEKEITAVADLLKLKFLGPKLVQKIEAELIKKDPTIQTRSIQRAAKPVMSNLPNLPTKPQSRASKPKKYIPRFRSGAYAILVALAKSGRPYCNKSEIIQLGSDYCEHSFTDPGYNSWSGMQNLLKNELVQKNNYQFSLTEQGSEIASAFLRQLDGQQPSTLTETPSNSQNSNSCPPTVLKAGTFDIFLVLDNREVRCRTDRDYFQKQLQLLGVETLTLPLPIADMLWVAQCKQTNSRFVIGWLIERKGNDDLLSSIKDARYIEQKKRLLASRRKIVYLVESFCPLGTPTERKAVQTSLTETMILNNFELKLTNDSKDTVNYLKSCTNIIKKIYANKDLKIESINDDQIHSYDSEYCTPLDMFKFETSKTSNMTSIDLWQRQLLTIKGLSKAKAALITKKYPTMIKFLEAIDNKPTKEQMVIVKSIGNEVQVFGAKMCMQIISIFT